MNDGTEPTNDYSVELNGKFYHLKKAQYKAYLRKRSMPMDRLEIWLKSYSEENKNGL